MEIKRYVIDKCICKVYTICRLEMINMEARLQKWGNSNGIRIPHNFLKLLNLKTNDKVNLNYENYKIIITKPKKEKKYLLKKDSLNITVKI